MTKILSIALWHDEENTKICARTYQVDVSDTDNTVPPSVQEYWERRDSLFDLSYFMDRYAFHALVKENIEGENPDFPVCLLFIFSLRRVLQKRLQKRDESLVERIYTSPTTYPASVLAAWSIRQDTGGSCRSLSELTTRIKNLNNRYSNENDDANREMIGDLTRHYNHLQSDESYAFLVPKIYEALANYDRDVRRLRDDINERNIELDAISAREEKRKARISALQQALAI